MSLDYSYSFGPSTPPDYSFEAALLESSAYSTTAAPVFGHSRHGSHASDYSQHSSPDSVYTQLTTPQKSPIRQHGPLLLPKIRPQDQNIFESAPPVAKRVKTSSTSSSAWRPSHARSFTNPEPVSALLTPISATTGPHGHSRSSSALCSPISMSEDSSLFMPRRSSTASLDGQTLGKYGFPYRQMPTYVPSASGQAETFVPASQPYYMPTPREPSPIRHEIYFDEPASLADPHQPTTALVTYLTSPNPAPSLVRQLNIHVRDTGAKHFWWDVRQIRPWTAFNTTTINSIPGLSGILSIPLPVSSLPVPPPPRTVHPETEAELLALYTAFYLPKLNAALAVAQGPRHLAMRLGSKVAVSTGSSGAQPSFTSNYIDDMSELIQGRGLGRVVGLVKSFDRWNTGMRVEGNHRKVEYLRGLAHLHRCMRENNCRYGFIMTEIEMVVVRNGAETTPHFGYLEVQTIQLAAHGPDGPVSSSSSSDPSSPQREATTPEPEATPMTALLALFYLHMLARDDPLPGQVHYRSEIGAPAEGTRQKCLPKDDWMPAPQLAEKREAKRIRGWVWPEEGVGRKELGRRGVKYSSC